MEYILDHQKEYQDYIGNWLRTVKWFVWTSKALRVIPHSTFRKKKNMCVYWSEIYKSQYYTLIDWVWG